MTAIGENLNVLPADSRDLRDPATQQIRTPDKGVVKNGVSIEMSCCSLNSSGTGMPRGFGAENLAVKAALISKRFLKKENQSQSDIRYKRSAHLR